MLLLPQILTKIPGAFFTGIEKNNPTIHTDAKRSQTAKAIIKNKAGVITLLCFKLYYKTIVIKIVWYWH